MACTLNMSDTTVRTMHAVVENGWVLLTNGQKAPPCVIGYWELTSDLTPATIQPCLCRAVNTACLPKSRNCSRSGGGKEEGGKEANGNGGIGSDDGGSGAGPRSKDERKTNRKW